MSNSRIALAFFVSLVFAAIAEAQCGTIISGTVTDPNGIPWAGGTIQATISLPVGASGATCGGAQIAGTTQRVTLDNTGSFLMQIPDSALLRPLGTSWTFAVNISPGVPLPLGKGPQNLSVTTPINCGTNTPAACVAGSMTITAALTPVPALSNVTSSTPGGVSGNLQFNNAGVFGGLTGSVAANAGTLLALTGNAATSNAVTITSAGSGQQIVLQLTGANANTQPVLKVIAGGATVAAGVYTYGIEANGTAAGLTGTGACATITTITAGPWAGNFTCTSATAASTVVITPGYLATHDFSCWANDITTAANILRQSTPLSNTACTIAGTVNANDVLTFGAVSY